MQSLTQGHVGSKGQRGNCVRPSPTPKPACCPAAPSAQGRRAGLLNPQLGGGSACLGPGQHLLCNNHSHTWPLRDTQPHTQGHMYAHRCFLTHTTHTCCKKPSDVPSPVSFQFFLNCLAEVAAALDLPGPLTCSKLRPFLAPVLGKLGTYGPHLGLALTHLACLGCLR